MALNAERQSFMEDPLTPSRHATNRSGEEIPWTASAKAPVLQIPQRESFAQDYGYDNSQDLKAKAARAVQTAKNSIAHTYDNGKIRVVEAYGKVAKTSADLAQRAQRHAVYMKKEKPMEVLAIAAGTAFALGIALRIWRSSRYEQ